MLALLGLKSCARLGPLGRVAIDIEYLERLQNKDQILISAIVSEHTSHLYRAALGLGFNQNQAEELVQETFVTFHKVVHRFNGKSKVKTFLFGIFYNKVKEARRELLKGRLLRSLDAPIEGGGEIDLSGFNTEVDPEKRLSAKQILTLVEEALTELGPLQKSVFLMKVVNGDDNQHICEVLGITTVNLRQLLSRGKRRIKQYVLEQMAEEADESLLR